MKTILPIFMFVALCSLQLAAQQTIRYKLELLEVYSNFPVDNDNGGPDPVWKVRGSLKFNDQLISPPISWDGAKRNVSSTGWFSDMDYGTDLPYVLADETLAYPGNGILDLCDNAIGFQIGDAAIGGLIAYEFDGNFGNIFNNGEEEDEYVRIYTTGVAMQAQYGEHGIEREFEILSENVPSADGSANNNDNWGWRFRVTMWIESGITGFVAVGEEGEPIEQVCEGGQYSLYARTEPGFTGGYFIFERSLDGGNTWDLYSGPSTRNYIRLEASYNTDIQYRVRLDGGPCLGGNPDNFIIFDPSNLPVRPSIQTSDFEISTTATCAGGDDGTLTLEALDVSNLPPDTDVRVQLEPVGADESDFVVPTDIILLGELPYTFTGLEAGDYVVNITALNVNDENVTSNCTVATPTITVEAIQLWEVDYVTAEGGTCTDDQGAADVWTNFPGFLPDPLNELLDSNGDVLYSSTDYTTAIFYQSLDPGDYQVRLTMGGCTTLSDVFTVPGPPAAAQLGTVTKFPQTPDYDIGCEFGQVDIQIEVPLGAPTYYIRLDNLDFPGTARGWSNQSAGSLLQTTASVGNYEITYTREDNGCRLSDNFEVTLDPLQIDRVEAPESEIVAVSGCTPNSGQVSLDVYGGRAPYTAFIDDIEVTPTSTTDFGTYTRLVIDEVAPYWHEARVEDVNGCRRFESFFIPANMAIGLDLQSSFDDLFVECYGGAEGLIRLVGSGGDGNYEYKIVETDNTYGPDNVFTDLPAGFYTCFMRDGLGCETSLVARVDEEFEITIDRVEVDPIYCTGSTARINVFIDGVFTCKSSNPNPLPHVAYEISTDGGATYFSVSEEEAEVVTSHPLGDCSSISVIYLDRFAGDFDIMVKKTGTDCESTNMMSITADQFVEPDAPLAISVVDTRDINCFGENNGFITAEVSGGYGQYRVELVQFSTLTPVPAGATVVDTKDLAEPGSVTFTSLSASPPGTGYGVQVKSSLIAGTDDFQVEGCLAQAPGRWLDSEDFVPIVLTGPDELDIGELTVLELRECDGTGGLIEVSGTTGGTPPYEYNINDGVYSTSPLLAANRRNNIVRVRDANGCIENAPTVRVNERDDFPLNVEFELLPPVGCDYERYGKFTITEGTGPFNLVYGQVFVETIDDARTLSGGASVYVLSELLETGTVYVELRDAATCFREFQFEIPNDAYDYEPLTGTTTVTPETCLSSGDGQVTITASGGVPPYTIVFAGNEIPGITYTAENLGTGIHYFGIRDAAGCVISVSAALNPINGGLSADYTSTPSAPCPDSNNGSLTISPIGGQGPYTLTWLDPDGFTVNNIAEGSSTTRNGLGREFEYDYEIMDNLGCIASFSALVTGVDPFEAVIDEVVQPSCAGLANGSISLAILVDGDPAPGTFLVSVNGAPPVEQTTFDNLPPDTYEFVVESDDGCAFTEELIVELTNQVTLSASAAATDVACQGGSTGSITVTAAGGSGDFQYSLDNGGSFQASPIFTGLSANTYDILVEESSGCQIIVADVVVADGITLAANFAATAVDCNGAATGSIMATPTNGSPPYTISINGGTPIDGLTANGLSAGTYEAIVSDANGCTVTSAPLTIDEPTALTLVASSNEGPLCNGDATGMVTLFADGGTPLYEYRLAGQLFSDEATFSGLDDGNYSFEVRDANGCITLLEDVVVQDPLAIEITLIESTPDFCGQSNGTAEVEATGGTGQLTYSWPNGDDTPMTTNLNAGIVLVTVTDANNCEETLEVLIGEVAAPTINIISVVDAFCTDNNGSIIVEGVGGTPPYSFAWSNSANTASIDNLSAGTYDLVLMDAANCTANISVEVDFVPPPTVLEAVTDATCELENGSITLTVNDGSGDYAYAWSGGLPGTATVNNVASGIYAYTVTDNVTGCIRTGDVVVGDSPAVQLALDMVTPAPCFGETGSIAVTATGGTGNYTYAWSHDGSLNAPEALDLPAGEYTVMVMDEVGCQASLTAEVLEPALLELSLLQVFSSNCGEPTGQATVEAEGGTPPYSYAWSHDLNLDDPVAGNLLPGDYVVTLTDANDCETELLVEVANINPPPVLEIEELIPSYCSDGQGSASVQATGGNPPYVYTWSHNDFFNTRSLDNLDAGDYTITVTDESGCTDEISFNISLETPGPTDIIVVEEIMSTCGQPDGSLTVEVIGGSPPYTYEWGQVLGNNSPTISGVPPGDYYLTVYDLNDCRIDVILPLSGTPSITLSLQEVNAADCSTSNGSIIIEATNNQGTITYTWSHDAGLNAPSATNLSAGSYSVTATDALGCEGVLESIIVGNNEGPSIITNVIDANCSNGNGEINLMVTGGQEPYNYTWSHDMFLNSETAVGLDDGIYSITVTDDNDCVAIVTETVDLLAAPELSILGTTASICGAATATASVAVEGGLAPYSFTWSHDPTQTTASVNNLPAGQHFVSVTDENGCMDVLTIDILDVAGPTALVATLNEATSCGFANGSLEVTPEGGQAPFTYTWSHDVDLTGDAASDLAGGTYTVVATDANGCTITATFEVETSEVLEIAIVTQQDENCGQENGQIEIAVNGSTGGLTYSWDHDPDLNAALAENLSAGAYTVVVIDGNDCTTTTTINIAETLNPVVGLQNSQDATCEDGTGSLQFEVTEGVAPYQYIWSHDADLDSATATDLSSGSYTLTVTDAAGCSAIVTESIVFQTPPSLVLLSTEESACTSATGAAVVEVDNGQEPFTFSWSHDENLNAASADGLAAGDYEVTVTDANSCQSTLQISITTVAGPTGIVLLEELPSTCGQANGSLLLTEMGGTAPYTYSWSHDATLTGDFADDLGGGTYDVTLTDANDCTFSSSFVIAESVPLAIEITEQLDANCGQADGSLSVMVANATGVLSYDWSHDTDLNSDTATGLSAGSYTVLVTDENSCEATLDFTVEDIGGPTLSLVSVQDALCENNTGQMRVSATGGTMPYTFSWSHDPLLDSDTAENLSGGTYSVMITDDNGCTATVSETIEWQSGPELTVESLVSSTCGANDGSALVTATGGTGQLTYSWAHDGDLDTGELMSVPAGTYDLTISDTNNCTVETSIEVTDIPGPTAIVANELQATTCGEENGSMTVEVVGGTAPFDLLWSHDSEEMGTALTNLSAGNYELTTTDANGCIITESFAVVASPLLEVSVTQTQNPDCSTANGQIEIGVNNAVGAINYTWSHDAGINSSLAADLPAGTYTVMVTDEAGCTLTETVNLSDENAPVMSDVVMTPSLCEDGQGGLSFTFEEGTAPYNYAWSHDPLLDSPFATALDAGDYVLTVTDADGCTLVTSGVVALEAPPELSIDVTTYLCEGGDLGALSLSISNGMAPYTVLWNTGADALTLTDLPAAAYTVTVTDDNGCESSAMIDLATTSTPIVGIQGNRPSCHDFSDGNMQVNVNGGSGTFNYQWSNGASEAEIMDLPFGVYTVTVTDAVTACTETASLELLNPSPLVADYEATASCDGNTVGTIQTDVEGGVMPYSYDWNNGASTDFVDELAVGTYDLTITDANDCDVTLTAEVPQNSLPVFSIDEVQPTDCASATGQVIITTNIPLADVELNWNLTPPNVDVTEVDGQTQILASGLGADTYNFTLAGTDACEVAGEFLIASENPWEAAIVSVVDASCGDTNDGMATVEVTGAGMFMYEWDTAAANQTSATATGLVGGTYSVTVTDENDCTQELEAIVDAPEVLEVNVLDLQEPLCADGADGSLSVEVSGGEPNYTYNWSDGGLPNSSVLENIGAGSYDLTVTDDQDCSTTITVELGAPAAIEINLESSTLPNCLGDDNGLLEALAQGGTGTLTYSWNDPEGQLTAIASNLASGTYGVTVTDENTCEQAAEFDLEEGLVVDVVSTELIEATCETAADGSISVEATGGTEPFTFVWSNGATEATVEDLVGGQGYSVTATNSEGCEGVLLVDVPLGDGIELGLPADTTLCLDDPLILELEEYTAVSVSGPDGFNSTESRPFLDQAGTYSLSVEDAFGCTADQDITLSYTTELLIASMVLPSDVVVNDSVVVLETSWPAPETVNWVYDPSVVELVKQLQNQYWFVFNTPGEYELGLLAGAGGCEDFLNKTITVHADSTTIPGASLGTLKIEDLFVRPNPNQGQFEVDVVLNNTAEVYLNLYDLNGIPLDRRQGENATSYTFDYQLPLQIGSYLLVVQTITERRATIIVVQ